MVHWAHNKFHWYFNKKKYDNFHTWKRTWICILFFFFFFFFFFGGGGGGGATVILLTHILLDKMAAIMTDDNFKCICLNEKIPIRCLLKFVSRSPIDNKPSLVQIMTWRRTGDKPLPEPMLTQHICGTMGRWVMITKTLTFFCCRLDRSRCRWKLGGCCAT